MEHCSVRCADVRGLAVTIGDKSRTQQAHRQSWFNYSGADIKCYIFFQVYSISSAHEQRDRLPQISHMLR